ncbi:MAG: AAA family ATPase [Candidatus Poribacteria bacterium]|nr:AAA family ATPase [Candidatus Poribacteria bacterium]
MDESRVTAFSVKGFKSLAEETRLELRPLTILAGANSSGKSSAMQPFLLMKQTLEATYEPEVFRLDGPNVSFTSSQQFRTALADLRTDHLEIMFETAIANEDRKRVRLIFEFSDDNGIVGTKVVAIRGKKEEIIGEAKLGSDVSLLRSRNFLAHPSKTKEVREVNVPWLMARVWMTELLHIPGFRGNPQRVYAATTTSRRYPGLFFEYTTSVIDRWQREDDKHLEQLSANLNHLDLTSAIQSERLNEAQIELRVGRTLNADSDFVSIADVGFGVSQVLPVLTALLVAEPNQPVYIEQPELHLHPRAQWKLSSIIADAAIRGVQVIIETHSDLLLLGIQTLIAEGELDPSIVALHWFERQEDGSSKVTLAELSDKGTYGDFPLDFGDVALEAERKYMEAQW